MKANVKKITAVASGAAICIAGALVAIPQIGGENYTPGSLDDNVFVSASSADADLQFNDVSSRGTVSGFGDGDDDTIIGEAAPGDDGEAAEWDGEDEALDEAGEDEIPEEAWNYTPGEARDYEGWFRVAAPSGFEYDSETCEFTNSETYDSFSFFASRYSDLDAANFEGVVSAELEYIGDISSDDIQLTVERRDVRYGDRNWAVIIARTPDEETGEMLVSLVEFLTDLGGGEYAGMSAYTEPDVQWIGEMLATFAPLPGDPCDNWDKYSAEVLGYGSADDEDVDWVE